MMSIILLSGTNLLTCVAIYLFNLLRPNDRFEKALNAFLTLLLFHLGIKLSLLVVWKSAFLYNNSPSGFGFAYGPLLYLTTLFYLKREVSFRMMLLHMSPLGFGVSVFLVNSAGYIEGAISPQFMHTYANIYEVGAFASLLIYPLLAWRLLQPGNEAAANPQRRLLVAIVRTILTGVLLALTGMVIYIISTGRWDLNVWILPYLCFVWLVVMILRYKIESVSVASPEVSVVQTTLRQYKKSGVDEEMMAGYERTLRQFMHQSRIYLEPELSLEELSDRSQIPRHHITQLLNEHMNRNFYTFINEYRIEVAIERLKDPSLDINLLSLAYDCGFNSKSSFNNYFKKITGITPSVYRKNIQQNIPVTIP